MTSIALANLAWFGEQAVRMPFATPELGLTPLVRGTVLASVGRPGGRGAAG